MTNKSHNRVGGVLLGAAAMLVVASAWASAAEQKPQPLTLFTNVHVFDGVSEKLIENANVLVEGTLIKEVSTVKFAAEGAVVIDGGGRTLMPGLSDTHVHLGFATLPQAKLFVGDPGYNFIYSVGDAEAMLMRGFTSVRDLGATSLG